MRSVVRIPSTNPALYAHVRVSRIAGVSTRSSPHPVSFIVFFKVALQTERTSAPYMSHAVPRGGCNGTRPAQTAIVCTTFVHCVPGSIVRTEGTRKVPNTASPHTPCGPRLAVAFRVRIERHFDTCVDGGGIELAFYRPSHCLIHCPGRTT